LQNSPLESSCVVVALIENYSSSKPLKVSPEKSHILSCDTIVANERYVHKHEYRVENDISFLYRKMLSFLLESRKIAGVI